MGHEKGDEREQNNDTGNISVRKGDPFSRPTAANSHAKNPGPRGEEKEERF
jgi:hypothetical protein